MERGAQHVSVERDSAPSPSAFIDEARIFVKAGDGGNGIVSFRREKFVPLGGPDGGDGGRGGDVILRGSRSINTLLGFQHRIHHRADRGGNGGGSKKHGKRGANLIVDVPLGTVVSTAEGFLADITHEGQEVPVARGGKGGLGNVHFATPVNRAPRMARKGEPGEEQWLNLELKSIGDVGFVGEPNAGKSSLLTAISAARPEIGAYPFTTLSPNLGVATIGDVPVVAVDIPGLIEGAHAGRGLGHRFLRHVQRSRILVHVLDAASEDPVGSYQRIRHELELFDPALAEKPELIAANKMDLPDAKQGLTAIRKQLEHKGERRVFPVSALTGEGIPPLLEAMLARMAVLEEEQPPEPTVRVYRLAPEEAAFTVEQDGDTYYVRGHEVELILARAYLETDEGLNDFQRQLERLGVFKDLEQRGVQSGDTVVIGDFEMEWT
jgi:GTPase